MNAKWNVIGRMADIVTIFGAIIALGALWLAAPAQQIVMASALALITCASVAMAWIQAKQLGDAAENAVQGQRTITSLGPFSDAIDDFKRGYYELARRDQDDPLAGAQGFVNRCEAACRDAATALQAITGSECRVTLQEVYGVGSGDAIRLAVRAIASSDRSAPTGSSTTDWVDENTDFGNLLAGEALFHSDDLRVSLQEGYRNSHWTPEKLREWKLTGGYPYLSTIVWPIRVRVDGSHEWTMAGFLSADSKETSAFDRAIVEPLGSAWASVAYTGLSLYGSIKDSLNAPTPDEEG